MTYAVVPLWGVSGASLLGGEESREGEAGSSGSMCRIGVSVRLHRWGEMQDVNDRHWSWRNLRPCHARAPTSVSLLLEAGVVGRAILVLVVRGGWDR
eukprot:3098823-Pyramimonas_sp.AAC.1